MDEKHFTKTKLKIHLREGLEMETNTSPIMRGAIAFAIIVLALSIFALNIAPLMSVIRWW